jgi:hypothetical protein
LIGDRDFADRRPPAGLQHFPADLANPDLEYSGIYEDGWIGEHAYAVVAGGPTGQLVLEGSRTATPGGRLEVRVDGRRVVDRTVRPEPFSIRARVPASRLPRKIELRLSGVAPLPAPDGRPVSALLSYLGVVPGR